MTPQEFKAWFDGFTEQMEKAPTAKQWERIKERVKEIDGTPVTERVFIDRYWQYYPYSLPRYPHTIYTGVICTAGHSVGNSVQAAQNQFSGTSAMQLLGKNEYQANVNA